MGDKIVIHSVGFKDITNQNKGMKKQIEVYKKMLSESERARTELEDMVMSKETIIDNKLLREQIRGLSEILSNKGKRIKELEQQLKDVKERNVQLTQKYEDVHDTESKELEELKAENKKLTCSLDFNVDVNKGLVMELEENQGDNIELRNTIKQLAKLLYKFM